jgi:hypothetical protein
MNINDFEKDKKKEIVLNKMGTFQQRYYDNYLDYNIHKRIYEKFRISENIQDNQIAKEANEEVIRIEYKLKSLEECFNEMKKEYDEITNTSDK